MRAGHHRRPRAPSHHRPPTAGGVPLLAAALVTAAAAAAAASTVGTPLGAAAAPAALAAGGALTPTIRDWDRSFFIDSYLRIADDGGAATAACPPRLSVTDSEVLPNITGGAAAGVLLLPRWLTADGASCAVPRVCLTGDAECEAAAALEAVSAPNVTVTLVASRDGYNTTGVAAADGPAGVAAVDAALTAADVGYYRGATAGVLRCGTYALEGASYWVFSTPAAEGDGGGEAPPPVALPGVDVELPAGVKATVCAPQPDGGGGGGGEGAVATPTADAGAPGSGGVAPPTPTTDAPAAAPATASAPAPAPAPSPSSQSASAAECFPADAVVSLPGGGVTPIAALTVGTPVAVPDAPARASAVLAWTHADAAGRSCDYHTLATAAGAAVTLTGGHLVPVGPAGVLTPARRVAVGDTLTVAVGPTVRPSRVVGVTVGCATGLYALHTASGETLVVGGVVVSQWTEGGGGGAPRGAPPSPPRGGWWRRQAACGRRWGEGGGSPPRQRRQRRRP
ncbi:hypothetical protein BU14_0258s0006 [Porphyra umbilicalis]|uniref:Hint domain-containing protein n=1 Tax=Porphyra umbilicalis TaxID=2786 RepID=A0A1X6P2A0_PORUM|nr:hypothetical protein BU14_0258s0006 [Porphyra umbilicalis]|eukprot:OSX75001.1 hypothetical protein BU14_0258s0006 [Porphyra umbilicalis]